ncbi:hypothetical protein PUN28_009468 [Cardiocondyla obscurior]|uniref:Uncharacterized protein n=2 Tax=Cardiocondyla obscurior TaxID=286306 RepID=A0AAW2FXS6_9HYME
MQSAMTHYYNINKMLMTKMGIWPKQHVFVKVALPTILTALIFSIAILELEYLMSLIDYHWRIFTHTLEVEIMHEYALVGRKMTITYSIACYSLAIVFMMMALTPQIMDLIIPLNESRPYIYLFDIDYSFDRDTYFYYVLLHAYVTIILAITTMLITDTSYMMFAHHASSLFAAIGYRITFIVPR